MSGQRTNAPAPNPDSLGTILDWFVMGAGLSRNFGAFWGAGFVGAAWSIAEGRTLSAIVLGIVALIGFGGMVHCHRLLRRAAKS